MIRCYRCHLRMVYRDEGDRICLACGRDQDVQPVVAVTEPTATEASRPEHSYDCEQCGAVRVCAWPSEIRRFCSRSCRTKYQMERQRQIKRWRELQIA